MQLLPPNGRCVSVEKSIQNIQDLPYGRFFYDQIMAIAEQELSRKIACEGSVPTHYTQFEKNFYGALQIDLSHQDDYSDVILREQILSVFPEEFFTEENEVTAAQLLTERLLSKWPPAIPLEQFQEGEKGIHNFCVKTIPILQDTYPEIDPDRLGHHIITASIIAHSKLREAYGITPIPNNMRTKMHFAISKELERQENQYADTVDNTGREIPIFIRY